MKKTFLKTLGLILCLFTVLSCIGCSNKSQSSEVAEEDDGLFEFDDVSAEASVSDQNTSGETASSGKTSGTVKKATADEVTVSQQVKMDEKDPFGNIPSRLKGTTVVFAHFGDEGASEYQKVCKAFTKKTGIKVKLVSYDQDTYVATVSKQIAAHSSPDVIICNEIFPEGLEIAQPIQNLLDLNESFWDPTVTKVSTIGKDTYFVNSLKGVWHNIDMVFYNKKIFSENSIKTPAQYYKEGKWTYENFRKCLEDVKKTGNVGGYADPKMMSAALGNALVSYDSAQCKFKQNLSAAVPAYEYCATNAKNGLWDSNLWWGNFNNGTIGVYIQSAYGCKYNGWFKDIDASNIGAVPTPVSYNGVACKQTESMRAYGLAKGAKNPEGAAYFLRYFLDYSYYKDAGAEVFRNKELETAYFNSIDLMAKEGINYYFNSGAYFYTTLTYKDVNNVGNGDPAQVQTTLMTYANQFESAVAKMNAKIAALK